MRDLICSVAVALALAPGALAQPFFFGDPLPLTDTRYGAFGGRSRLVSSDTDAFLAWSAENGVVRMTRIVDGERRVGRPLFQVDNGWFDVVWTGLHFLAVGYRRAGANDEIIGRLVDFTGEPLGPVFVIGNGAGEPRLAFDGTFVLLQFRAGNFIGTAALTPEGRALEPLPRPGVLPPFVADAAVASHPPGFISATAYTDVVALAPMNSGGVTVGTVPLAVSRYEERRIAVATNPAREIVAVWTNGTAPIDGALIRNNGTMLQRFTLTDTEGARELAVTWDGQRWVLAFIAQGRLHVRRFDRAAPEQRLPATEADAASNIALTSVNGRTYAAFRDATAQALITVRNIGGPTDSAAFAAAEQALHDATASATAVLAVWSERRDGRMTMHAGVRTSTGAWRERPIGTEETAALAASDGTGFAVIRAKGTEWSAVLLDSQTRILATSPPVTGFIPTGIAWTGAAYAVVGLSPAGNVVGTLLGVSGGVTATRTLVVRRPNRSIENPRVAARNGELLVIWQDTEFIPCFPVCDAYDSLVHGARFTPLFDRVDAEAFSIAPDEARYPDAVWTGIHYFIVWQNRGRLEYRTLRSNGAISGITQVPGVDASGRVPRVALVPGGVGMAYENGEVVVIREGTTSRIERLGRVGTRDALITMAGKAAYLQPMARDEMPYHGATRLQLRAGDLITPGAPPSAPRITYAALQPGTNAIYVEWTAPPEAVNGYRIEYRVDEGAWNELDEWFDPSRRALAIRPWRTTPVRYQFRVRAWSDTGLSAYSNEVTARMETLRQRATRR